MDPLSTKLDVRLSSTAREALDRLAQRHGCTSGAEARAAIDLWVEFHRPAAWLDAEDGGER